MPSNKLKINPFTVSVQEACQLIGISISTLYRHQPKDEAEAEKRAPTDYPIIKKTYGRSFVLYADIQSWAEALGRQQP